MRDLDWKGKVQPWPLKLIYSHFLISFNISGKNKHFGFNSIQKINFSKQNPFKYIRKQRIIDGLGLIRLFFWFPERCFWASSVVHVVSVQQVNLMARAS